MLDVAVDKFGQQLHVGNIVTYKGYGEVYVGRIDKIRRPKANLDAYKLTITPIVFDDYNKPLEQRKLVVALYNTSKSASSCVKVLVPGYFSEEDQLLKIQKLESDLAIAKRQIAQFKEFIKPITEIFDDGQENPYTLGDCVEEREVQAGEGMPEESCKQKES